MREPYRHLTHTDRVRLETLHSKGHSPKEIAKALKIHLSTVYRELKRGFWIHTNTDLTENTAYSSDKAQMRHDAAVSCRGVAMKLGNDQDLATYIEYSIGVLKKSPAATLGEIKANNMNFKTSISVPTLYSYIDKDVFFGITNKDLPIVSKRKREYNTVKVVGTKRHKRLFGESIESRPKHILNREEFGHWEMDTVKGTIRQRSCLLVLTERKTRMEIIRKISSCSTKCVVEEIKKLRDVWGMMFSKVFKTITVDNGTEFSDYEGMMLPTSSVEKLKIYYCHPYSSSERGSNENANKLIRRHIPKKTNFSKKTQEEIMYIQEWINFYPRKIFDFSNSNKLFIIELERLLE